MNNVELSNNFKKLNVGDQVEIHSYKHDGKIHRVWKYAVVVEINDDYLVVVNENTRVFESNGRVWCAKEPAVCFFFKDKWFNIISMIRNNGILHYCNIASPFIWDNEAIKYIDYDLDLKIFANNRLKVLDEREFELHTKTMGYSLELQNIVLNELEYLKSISLSKDNIFYSDYVYEYYNKFLKLTREGKIKKHSKKGDSHGKTINKNHRKY